tara:strand:- start:3616 stop:3753 length:138 start_codon:yes stop_codon:yes gene_type:complete
MPKHPKFTREFVPRKSKRRKWDKKRRKDAIKEYKRTLRDKRRGES